MTMAICCEQNDLQSALALASKGATGRSTQPIVGCIHIGADANTDACIIRATDLETIGVEVTLGVDVEHPGEVAVSARELIAAVSKLPGGTISLEGTDANGLTISTSDARTEIALAGMDPVDYQYLHSPHVVPDADADADAGECTTIALPATELRGLVGLTAFACGTDQTRPILTGALLELLDGELRMVATDTYRMAICEAAEFAAPVGSLECILPASVLRAVATAIPADAGDATATIEIAANASVARIALGDRVAYSTRPIAGHFVAWRRVVPDPAAATTVWSCAASELAAALARMRVVAAADAGRVKCHLSPGQMVATLKASSHVGTATEQLVSSCRGEPLDIGFGAPLLADMLSSLPQGATLEVLLQGTTGLAGMRCADVPGWQFVLCPMRDV